MSTMASTITSPSAGTHDQSMLVRPHRPDGPALRPGLAPTWRGGGAAGSAQESGPSQSRTGPERAVLESVRHAACTAMGCVLHFVRTKPPGLPADGGWECAAGSGAAPRWPRAGDRSRRWSGGREWLQGEGPGRPVEDDPGRWRSGAAWAPLKLTPRSRSRPTDCRKPATATSYRPSKAATPAHKASWTD